jgi:hypothetical protein
MHDHDTSAASLAIALGSSPDDFLQGFISEEDYAARRGVSLRTCQRDRQLRQAPPYVLIGRRVYYRVEAVRNWLIACEQAVDRKPSAPRSGKAKSFHRKGAN